MKREKNHWDLMEWIAFLSKFIEFQFKKILVFFFFAVCSVSLFMFVRYLDTQDEQGSFDRLSEVIKTYREKKEKFEKALEKESLNVNRKSSRVKKPESDEKDRSEKNLLKASGDLSQDYGEVVTKLETFLGENKGQKASIEGALILSEIYMEYKMEEKAIQILEMVLLPMEEKGEKDHLLFNLLSMRLGNLWMLMPEACKKALPYFRTVGESKSFMAPQAQLKTGFCFQKNGDIQSAKTWYEKVKKNFPESLEALSVKNYLRFLKFQSRKNRKRENSDKETNKDQSR